MMYRVYVEPEWSYIMVGLALALPRPIAVNRTELRSNQREVLKKANGSTVVVVTANDQEEEKVVVDREYFDEMLRRLNSLKETLEIATDKRLLERLMTIAARLDDDVLHGRLRTLDQAFEEAAKEDSGVSGKVHR